MKKTIKKTVSILLSLIMVFSIFASVPMTAHAYQYYEEFTKNAHDVINLEDYVNVTNNKDGTITVQMPHFGDKSFYAYGLFHPSAASTTFYKCHYAYKFKEQSDYLDEVSTVYETSGYLEWMNHKVQDHTPFGSQTQTIDITNGKPYTGLYVVCHQHNDYQQNDPEAYETAADPCPAPGQEYIKGVYDYRNPVKITYNLNGGNVGGSTTKTEYLFSGNPLATTFSTPQRTGWVFKGWYTAASGGTKVTSSNATEATTYYAQWQEKPSVTLNGGNNATRSGGSVYQEPSGAMTKVTYTANSGYYFKQSDFPVSSNGITATWKSDTTVEVTGTPTTHVSLTVPDAKPRASVTTAPTANELTETGSYQNLVSAGSASGGTMYYAVTTENTMPDASSYSTTIPTGRGGTYYVWYKTVGDENHIDTTPASVTVTLNEGEVTKPTSFKQATSLGDITEDNIESCTFAQAKSWIVANWDNVVAGAGIEYVKVAYYNSDTDKLNVWSLNGWESKDKFLNNSYDYFREQGSIGDLQQCYGDDEYVYLCGAAAPAPSGPEEPTSDLFTKISSADEITDERIRTCTKEEAKAWILENWDDVVDPTKYVDFAYYDSDTGNLDFWSLNQCGSKDAFLNNSDSYFCENRTINQLQQWYGFGDIVYLCTGVASAPEPAYTVSFEKAASANEITADNIDTCTMEEAATWIVANWESIEISYWGSTYFAYYSGDSLCAFRLSKDTNKNNFESNYSPYSVNGFNPSNVDTWDDIVYLCKTATAVAEPVVNNVYSSGFVRLSDLSVGDVVVKDVSSIQTNNCTIVLYGGRYGQGNPVNVCTSSLTLGNPSIANSPDLQFEDFSNHKSYYPVDASGNIANAFIVMAKDGNTLTLAGINLYTITWKDGNNNTLATEVYGGGAIPSYNGATPTKASTALYTYTFAGWSDGTTTYGLSDTLPAVSGDVTYTAQFNQTTRKYKIIWKSDANTIIGISKVAYEITPYHAALAGYEDAQYIYTFAGWSDGTNTYPVNKLPLVTADATYTAVYNATEKKSYTVIWKNGDTTLETDTDVAEGTTPTYNGATPTKASTAQYTYTFAGWSPEVAAVTGDVTYTAQFNQTTRNYTITWKSDANTVIDTTQVAYGATPTYDGTTPTKASTAQYTYTFNGWTPTVVAATEDAIYTATFTGTLKEYTITFVNADGTTLQSGKVAYGTTPSYDGTPTKEADDQYTYEFTGWTPAVVSVSSDATYIATYAATPIPVEPATYTVTWKNYDGTTLETDTDVAEGTVPTYDGTTPEKAEDENYTYTFSGWTDGTNTYGVNDELPAVTGDITYTAMFGEVYDYFSIRGGTASLDETTNTVTIVPNDGSVKLEVFKRTKDGSLVTFSDFVGGATRSRKDQAFARINGTVTATVGETAYNIVFVFPTYNIEDLLEVTGADMTVDSKTITLTATADQIKISPRTTANTMITFGTLTGKVAVAKGGSLYAIGDGTAVITVHNAGEFTVVFDFAEPEFVFTPDLLKVTNAQVAVDGTTITLTPVDESKQVNFYPTLWDGTAVTFSDVEGLATTTNSGTLYAKGAATAKVTIDGVEYTVVFDYVPVEKDIRSILKFTGAEGVLDGTTLTLTAKEGSTQINLYAECWDGTTVATFSNLEGCGLSKSGTLYAKNDAAATMTIDGVEYTVVFDFEEPEFVFTPDLLKITNADVAVEGTTITLTAVDNSKQVNFYPTLWDGTAVEFSNIEGLAATSKTGTLYAKGDATATVTIDGVEYTVVFDFPQAEAPDVSEILNVTGADVSVEGTTITLNATGTKVCFYSSLKDGSKATYSKSTITEGLNTTATVSKSGTLYAIGDASAVVTIGGVDYTVNFVF